MVKRGPEMAKMRPKIAKPKESLVFQCFSGPPGSQDEAQDGQDEGQDDQEGARDGQDEGQDSKTLKNRRFF